MKCQQCAKTATVQITEIHAENSFEELHLCDDCAQKFLTAHSLKKKKIPESIDPLTEKQCDQCGTKFIDFRNSGRLGCPHDYDVFLSELVPLLENIHGGLRHTGKTPRSRPGQKLKRLMLNRIREELKEAIETEAYEAAAQLRDRLRDLEKE